MFIADNNYFFERLLDSTPDEVVRVLANLNDAYRSFQIPKADGSRTIQAIDRESRLYHIQQSLYKNFLNTIPLPTPVTGFLQGSSYMDFLLPHIGREYFMRVDLSDFFGSITIDMARACFREFFPENDSESLEIFLSLCTHDGGLPQGAVTSPSISNIIFRRLDQRILKYCQSFDALYRNGQKLSEEIRYTRYADDLLFSSTRLDFSENAFFLGMIKSILASGGFQINQHKLKYGCRQISLSGFVVSDDVHLSRKRLYSINKLIHFFGKTPHYSDKKYRIRGTIFANPNWLGDINALNLSDRAGTVRRFSSVEAFLDYLCGYRSFLLCVYRSNPNETGSMRQLQIKLAKLELIIDAVLLHST